MDRPLFAGSGPGAQAPDGCSVELYARTPYLGELECLLPVLQARPGLRVLELGSGTGRLTRRLLELGCQVTAVDNSPEMLAQVPEAAARRCADIASLDLGGDRFDVVLLASGLINHPDALTRKAFLQTCTRHLDGHGRILLQRQDPAWLATATIGTLSAPGASRGLFLESVERSEGLVRMRLRYREADGASWLHDFTLTPLDDEAIGQLLATAGFGAPQWLDPQRCWAASRRSPGS